MEVRNDGLPLFFLARSAPDGTHAGGLGCGIRKILQTHAEEAAQGCAAEQEEMMVSDEALKKLQEQIAAWPMTQRFVVQQLIEDYRMDREDLRAYKATGLTPQEVISMDGEWAAMMSMLNSIGGGYTRLRELAEADKDGRLVVLPCKVGDKLYRVFDGNISEHEVQNMKYFARQRRLGIDMTPFFPDAGKFIGKTVFFTREEAEEALEAKKDE